MNPCFAARHVDIVLRSKRTGRRQTYTLAVPLGWSRAQLLRYVRTVHPGKTARVAAWEPALSSDWRIPIWIPDPEGWRA